MSEGRPVSNTIIKMEGVCKAFSGVPALHDVDFELEIGEVHALLGENGAGKSTLMKCLAGIYPADAGRIYFDSKPVKIAHVQDSLALGVGFIQQELVLADQLTVAENIYMGREPQTRMGFIDRRRMFLDAQAILDGLESGLNAHLPAGMLGIAQKQIVEIARSLSLHARVIIMDEPTAALSKREVDKLFDLIRALKEQGISIVYISHRMEEIFAVSDRITVLRDGVKIKTLQTEKVTHDELIRLMVGHSLEDYYGRRREHEVGGVILEATGLSRADGKTTQASFTLRRGEILGFAGLVGAGRTELVEMLFGIKPASSGTILLNGKKVSIRSPEDAMRLGIGLVPEDRKVQGLVLNNTVRFNLTLGVLREFIRFIRLNKEIEREITNQYVEMLSIKVASPEQQVVNLSGGNQQKVALAKWLAAAPKILILDEPTRGIDVGAKSEIYALMADLVRNGVSIIMVSSELPELMNMSDRMYVMHSGKIKTCLSREEATQETILRYALGVKSDD
jgi:ribose transport system ATP-binding protein/inositol transport system ATP-binding protein